MRGLSVVLAAIALAITTSWLVLGVVLPSWNTKETLATGVSHARSELPPAPGLGRIVVFVVLDGVGYDRAVAEPSLARLREQGAMRPLLADAPTFTAPAITAMFVGQGPRESGVRLNGAWEGVRGLDDALRSSWDAGVFVRTRSRTFAPFAQLARPPRGADVVGGRLPALLDRAERRLGVALTPPERTAVELTVMHLGEVDDAGHEHGAASPAYAAALTHAGDSLDAIARSLDPERDLLLVASDHGHRDVRGHGGTEPEVVRAFFLAWGRGVRRGVALEPRPMRDVASTLTSVVGASTPSSNMGRPQLDLFELDPTLHARRLAEPFDAAARYLCALTPSPDCERAEGAREALAAGRDHQGAEQLLDALAGSHDARAERATTARRERRTLVCVVSLAAVFLVARRLRWFLGLRPLALLAPAAIAAPYVAWLLARGYGPSMSAMAPTPIFLPHAVQGALLAAALVAFAAYRLRWGTREAAWLLVATPAALVPLLGFAGADPRDVGHPIAGTLVFQLSPLVYAAAIAAIAIVVGARLRGARREPP